MMNHYQHLIEHGPSNIDIDLPLHPDTDNSEDVARLVTGILGDIDALTAGHNTTQQDIVQALSIATALHAALGEVSAKTGKRLTMDLKDIRVDSPRIN